jgi:hypothetical protein
MILSREEKANLVMVEKSGTGIIVINSRDVTSPSQDSPTVIFPHRTIVYYRNKKALGTRKSEFTTVVLYYRNHNEKWQGRDVTISRVANGHFSTS